MLRVMKQKVKDGSDDLSRQSSSDSRQKTSSSSPENSDKPVSNVPQSISVPQVPSCSSNSSVSSYGLHVMDPLTRKSSDETASGAMLVVVSQDSPVESSVSAHDPPTNAKGSLKRTNSVAFSRKVSESDIGESKTTAVAQDDGSLSAAPCKRQKPSAPPTMIPSIRLLALPQDSSVLNSLHAFVRMQIEVFCATPADIALPAPGRRTPIKLHQVGLRCIHCRHFQSRDRVKRAVCYPTSVSRIYHSVSDMKFDHFTHCRGRSPELRAKFQALKEECASKRRGDQRGPGSTAQYYQDAASKMGLVDSRDGIFMAGQVLDHCQLPASLVSVASQATAPPAPPQPQSAPEPKVPADAPQVVEAAPSQARPPKQPTLAPASFPAINAQVLAMYHNLQNSNGVMFPQDMKLPLASPPFYPLVDGNAEATKPPLTTAPPVNDKVCLLAMPEDSTVLNPLHCFVRRNVEVFIANKDDVVAPAPGRRTRIKVGQVGLRCIHCARSRLPTRVKRAVCYPPSVGGIYHSVSNMKFDHFGKCKELSPSVKLEFESLRNANNRRNVPGGVSSTAQYYEESAIRLGLMDTQGGIQFRDQQQEEKGSVTDGISALMIAATSVRAELDRRKADTEQTLGDTTSGPPVASV